MRKLLAATVTLIAVVALAGCGNPMGSSRVDGENPGDTYSRAIKTASGKTVDCVFYGTTAMQYGVAISCDWQHEK